MNPKTMTNKHGRKRPRKKQGDGDASSRARDDDHDKTSQKKKSKRKHHASSSKGKELTEDAGPTKEESQKWCTQVHDAKHVPIAMDLAGESTHESVSSFDSLDLIETNAMKTNPVMKNTDKFIHETMGNAMAEFCNQFQTHSH